MTESTFIFQNYELLPQEGKILFHYTVKSGEETYNFTDTLILPAAFDENIIPEPLLKNLLNNCLLMLGISYWKLFVPQHIEVASFALSNEQADFWNTVYTKGLGQFFYENKIDFRNRIQFPFDPEKKTDEAIFFPRQNRSLLPVGGGKDSIVSAELLKKAEKPFTVLTLYSGLTQSPAQAAVAQEIGHDSFVVKRLLDPQLFELNKRSDTFNGHVPAVAMHSWVSIFLAALFDYTYVIFSNEESANYGNVEYLGEVVNHQWSKSLEFEKMLQKYLSTFVTQDIVYFSLLRPFSEIKIAQLFAEYPQYLASFVSCNRGYRIATDGCTGWCGECPKCAFVFVMLAAFLPKKKVIEVFGKNLFNDEKLLPLYKELLGVEAFKPFECVGTPEEIRLALFKAWEKGEWKDDVLMQLFVTEVLPKMQNNKEQEESLLSLKEHVVPEEFRDALQI